MNETKFKCDKCNSDVSDIQVSCCNVSLTRSFNNFKIKKSDTTSGYVSCVAYDCPKCGLVSVRCEETNLQDFFDKKFESKSFKKERYGSLIVKKG